MGGLRLEAEERLETTTISNLFIDRYMPRANGEYIKIYLLLLRYFQTPAAELSVSALADFLECTEKDVQRGLKYWQREGVVSLSFDGQKKLSGVRLLDLQARLDTGTAETAVSAVEPGMNTRAVPQEEVVEPGRPAERKTAKSFKEAEGVVPDMNRLSQDEAFSQLISVVGAYKKKPLSHEDSNILAYLYDTLGMSAELLEYLAEACVESGITSVRTMEKIALGWHERGIETPLQAKVLEDIHRQDMWRILKAFGISGRNPVASEKKMMEKWLMQYGFDLDVIVEACDRTVRQIHEPSFPYADKILKSWKDSGVQTKQDIGALDAAPRAAKSTEKSEPVRNERTVRSTTRQNRFHNYQQRDTDYDSLIAQRDLLKNEKNEQ